MAVAYTTRKAARVTDVPLHMVEKAIRSGQLAAHRMGESVVILRDDLEKWITGWPTVSDESFDCPTRIGVPVPGFLVNVNDDLAKLQADHKTEFV